MAAVRLELAGAAQHKGDYKEARTQVDDVLRVDPTNAAAIEFKSGNEKLLAEQRGRIPSEEVRSQVPAIIEDRVKASTLVHDGKLLFEMDKLDEAEAKLKMALKQDPHNEAGLYYLNLVSEAKYTRATKLHEVTMRQDIRAVEQAWANPISREMLPVPNQYAKTNLVHTGQGRQTIITKLDRIRLDKVQYDGLPLGEVINSLNDEAKKRDPEKRGINFLLNQNIDSAVCSGRRRSNRRSGRAAAPARSGGEGGYERHCHQDQSGTLGYPAGGCAGCNREGCRPAHQILNRGLRDRILA